MSIIAQYQVNGFRVDFYIPEAHLAIEYDERHHCNQAAQRADKERQSLIEKKSGMKFVRVIEGMEERGLFTTANFVFQSSPDLCFAQ